MLKRIGGRACKLGTGARERQARALAKNFTRPYNTPPFWAGLSHVDMKRDNKPPASAEIARFLGYGMTWALSTLLFLYLGSLADKRLGTEPVLTLIGAFVGATAGFYAMYRRLVDAQKPPTDRERDE